MKRTRITRIGALILALLFVLAPTGALAEETAKQQPLTEPAYSMELSAFDKNACKLTIYGIGDLLDYMRSTIPNYQCVFRYNIRFNGERNIDLHGRLRFYHYKDGGPESIQWISSILECKNITYDVKRAMTKDRNQISWIIWFPKWMNFSPDTLQSVDFKLYNAYETRQKVEKTFKTEDILTDVMLRTDLVSGGKLVVEAPAGMSADKSYAKITITDPDLASGYTNSAGGKGSLKPVWYIKLAHGSYIWVDACVDGSGSQAQDKMDFRAGYFQLNKDESNKYNSGPEDMTARCSYSISGDTLTITLNAPPSFREGLQYMYWIQVDMHGGKVSHKYKIQ